MTSLAAVSTDGAGPLFVAAVLGALGFYWLLPKPRHHSPALGTFAAIAGGIVLAVWIMNRFGPVATGTVEAILFWLFSSAAAIFATVFVTARNPARGAIAFAFVIISVCGLFLLLAAPFLMAATIIVYAGAIIVTFLFVLMLSHTRLASDENDRSREPLLGSLAGFSFLGLVLFALFTSTPAANADAVLPARPMLPSERATLLETAMLLSEPPRERDAMLGFVNDLRARIATVVGGPDAPRGASNIPDRLAPVLDADATKLRQNAEHLRETAKQKLNRIENKLMSGTYSDSHHEAVQKELSDLASEVRMLAAHGELPARNVANLGYTLYSDYILTVELAGALLLVATVGAVLIASRREVA